MKLYLSPGACSLAAHIVLVELGLAHTTEKVDLKAKPHVLASGAALETVNPKGSVPVLKLDNGEIITENAVILQFLADQKPEADLLPRAGTMERYHALEWLSYLASDLHKAIGPFWNPQLPDDMKPILKQNLNRRLAYLDNQLSTRSFLMGEKFMVGDAYLFVLLSWLPHLKLDMAPYANLKKFQARMADRPSVHQAIRAEH